VLGAHRARILPDHLRASLQYVKQEALTQGEFGKEARATRLITERASERIGKMAFELALARPRKVPLTSLLMTVPSLCPCIAASHHNTQVQRAFCHGRVVQRDY
jgi:hypothetical protein